MKTTTLALSSLLLAFSSAVMAEKVIITGEPVVLENKDGIYMVPGTYTATTTYNYVSLGGTNYVCYVEKQPSLASLDLKMIDVEVGGKRAQWNCYAYSDEYFTVNAQ